MSDKLGNRIKQLRQKADMTQSELADFFHVSSDYLLGINSSFLQDIDELSYEETLAVQKMSEKPDGRSLGEEERDQLTGVLKKSAVEAKITSRMWGKREGTLFYVMWIT